MFDRISYCGLDCMECPVYQATIENDAERRVEIATQWSSSELHLMGEDICCDGCTTEGGRLFYYGEICEVRHCAQSKGVRNCAWCGNYPCEKLIYHYELMGCSGGKVRLDQIRDEIIR